MSFVYLSFLDIILYVFNVDAAAAAAIHLTAACNIADVRDFFLIQAAP